MNANAGGNAGGGDGTAAAVGMEARAMEGQDAMLAVVAELAFAQCENAGGKIVQCRGGHIGHSVCARLAAIQRHAGGHMAVNGRSKPYHTLERVAVQCARVIGEGNGNRQIACCQLLYAEGVEPYRAFGDVDKESFDAANVSIRKELTSKRGAGAAGTPSPASRRSAGQVRSDNEMALLRGIEAAVTPLRKLITDDIKSWIDSAVEDIKNYIDGGEEGDDNDNDNDDGDDPASNKRPRIVHAPSDGDDGAGPSTPT